jgi:hypothetical protein
MGMKIYSGFITEHLENRVRLDPELINKPITIFYDYPIRNIDELKQNPYNLLFIQEPNQLFGFHDWALQNGHLFDIIFTWGDSILNKHQSNSIFFPFGPGDYEMSSDYQSNKNYGVSFMCGPKNMIEGHHLRHEIFSKESDILIPTKFFFKGEKRPCWTTMYHIAVENSRNNGYFTEKIIDAFLSKTIPIYWGCLNIDQFFNKDGIITFNSTNELIDIVNTLTPDYYESKKDAIEENYIKAMEYADFLGRINNVIKEVCKINNIV